MERDVDDEVVAMVVLVGAGRWGVCAAEWGGGWVRPRELVVVVVVGVVVAAFDAVVPTAPLGRGRKNHQ